MPQCPSGAKLEAPAVAWRLSEPGIRGPICLKSMSTHLSLMNQIVWLSAGPWQRTRVVSVKGRPEAVPPAAPPHAGLAFLLGALGDDLELSDGGRQTAEPRCPR